MQNKQTDVQWLIENMQNSIGMEQPQIDEVFSKALQMEREQHKETWLDSSAQFASDARMDYPIDFEIYYTQTFTSSIRETNNK